MCLTTGMSDVFSYRDLNVWKQSMSVVEECYRITDSFPPSERIGLTNQIRRAAISIPASVAEGRCRHTTAAFLNHISVAMGAVGELETCIDLSARLGYLGPSDATRLVASIGAVGRLLSALHRSLDAKRDHLSPGA
jgi:four helix bundle protein